MEDNLCKICCQTESKYICPRCNIPYCSLPCYQAQIHAQCSERFYKECVVEEIKNEELDPQSQKRMMEILQRVQQIDNQFDDEELVDSDDESDDELASRLAGIDLDDADKVWDQLTQEEKHQFEELLRSGDVSKVIPQWQPWWNYREKKRLVEDLDDNSQPEEDEEIRLSCPPIKEDIEQLSKLSKVVPSPQVRWNVVNVLAAYVLTARVYNGDHQSSALEASTTLMALCDNLTANQVFQSPELAVAAVQLAAANGNNDIGGDETQLKEDVQKLVEGPSEEKQNQYVLAALSDIHSLFTTAKQKAKENNKSKSQGEFSKRFKNSTSNSTSTTSASDFNKYVKKIEFYLSWAKECF